jgi:hypothetical protein
MHAVRQRAALEKRRGHPRKLVECESVRSSVCNDSAGLGSASRRPFREDKGILPAAPRPAQSKSDRAPSSLHRPPPLPLPPYRNRVAKDVFECARLHARASP